MHLQRLQLFLSLLLSLAAGGSFAAAPKAAHAPVQPKSGEPVRLTARFKKPWPVSVTVQYKLIDPGHYIARADPVFQTNWIARPMDDDGLAGDAEKNDGVFTVLLPGALQTHRRLVRYRIAVSGSVVAPASDDSVPNFAYFVYDGIPPWRGAVNPSSPVSASREVRTFGTNIMRSLPTYHLIAKKTDVENTAWYQPAPWGNTAARKAYHYTGTFIGDDGRVYDHVGFRARGGSWRYAMGKTMWKFDFNAGHHFTARDDFGEPYKVKWDKVNLGACIQHADYGRRGEHGMYEALGFKVFNLAGVETARTHWVQLRIIDEAEEAPANQYGGDFWGLYLALENLDDAFLKEHGLPAGNLYKMEFGVPDLHTHSPHAEPANADVRQFIAGYQQPQPEAWWRNHLDLPRYYSYRALLECLHHYDVYTGKNYFYYHHPQTGRWSVLPWDIDHSWGDRMHGDGQEPFMVLGLTTRAPFQMKDYVRTRGAWVDETLLNDPAIPPTPNIVRDGPYFRASLAGGWPAPPVMQWRLAEMTPGASQPRQGVKYEITPLWQTNGTSRVPMPSHLLDAGRTYRVRARVQDDAGRCGHWSEPVQFTVPQ